MEKSHMRRATLNFERSYWASLAGMAVIVLMGYLVSPAEAQQAGQKTFSSAEEASEALVAAARSNDEKAMLSILGADGKEIVSSGDQAEDAETRTNFVGRY